MLRRSPPARWASAATERASRRPTRVLNGVARWLVVGLTLAAAPRHAAATAPEEPATGATAAFAAPDISDVDAVRAASVQLTEAGKRLAAIDLLERARAQHPRDAGVRLMLGTLYRDANRIRDAESAFRQAVALDKRLAPAWGNLAALLQWRGEHRDALAAADRAVELAPEDAGYRADRAVIHYGLGHLSDAITDARSSLEARPHDASVARDLAVMHLRRATVEDARAAVTLLQRLRREAPEDDTIALAWGQALLGAGRTDEAARVLDTILARNPRQGWAAWGRAIAAWRHKEHVDARRLAQIASSVVPRQFHGDEKTARVRYSPDSDAFRTWLDGQNALALRNRLTPEAAAARSAGPALPTLVRHLAEPAAAGDDVDPAPRVSSLDIKGGCDRTPVMRQMTAIARQSQTCFGGRSGSVKLRFRLRAGTPQSIQRYGAGMGRRIDRCLIRKVRAAKFPSRASCTIKTTITSPDPTPPPAGVGSPEAGGGSEKVKAGSPTDLAPRGAGDEAGGGADELRGGAE